MSTSGSWAYSSPLTNYAVSHYGVVQDIAVSIGKFLAPRVKSNGLHGYYKYYDRADAFEVPKTKLADHAESNYIDIKGEDKPFGLQEHGLKTAVTDRQKLGAGDGLQAVERNKVAKMIGAFALADLLRTVELVQGNITATSLAMGSTDAPIAALKAAVSAFRIKNGFMPNRMIIADDMWNALAATDEALDILENAKAKELTGELLMHKLGYSDVPGASIEINKAVVPYTKDGVTGDMLAGEILLYFASDNADLDDRSAIKCITCDGDAFFNKVISRHDDAKREDVHELISYNESVIAAPDSIMRFNKAS